jgi:hypothetical protein
MGIALTDDHRELAEVARAFLTTQQARGAARSLLDSPSEARPPFWQELAGLGWLGLHVDEEYGGSSYGLPELVVDSLSAYEARALQLACDAKALRAVKSRLAANRDRLPLFDTARFTRHLEAAFDGMRDRHRRGLPPESFAVASAP